MKKQNKTYALAMLMGLYWMACITMFGYATVLLLHWGYNGSQIGIIIAIACIVTAMLQPGISTLAGASKRYSMVDILTVLGICFMVLAALLLVLPKSFWLTAVLFTATYIVNSCMTPLINSCGFAYESAGIYMNFGLGRGTASLTFGLISTAMGYVVAKFGTESVLVVSIFMMILTLLVLRTFFPHVALGTLHIESKQQKETEEPVKNEPFFKKYPVLLVVFTGMALVAMGATFTGNYSIMIIENVGGNAATQGTMLAIAAYLEIPAMFSFVWAVRKFGASNVLKLAAVFHTAKSVLMMLAGNVTMIYIAQLTCLLGQGLFIPIAVEFPKASTDLADQVKSQGIYGSFAMISSVIASLLGGLIVDGFGVTTLTITASTVGVIGCIIIFLFARDRKQAK